MQILSVVLNINHYRIFEIVDICFYYIFELKFASMKTKKIEILYTELAYEELAESDKRLIDSAILGAKSAYAPYSEFFVGSAVQLLDGTILKANNQENAAYPSGLCAERVVLFYANAVFPDSAVHSMAIAVIDKDGKIIDENISPCGSCRQVIAESEMRFNQKIRILLASKKSVLIFNSIQDLLPLSFNQGNLKK